MTRLPAVSRHLGGLLLPLAAAALACASSAPLTSVGQLTQAAAAAQVATAQAAATAGVVTGTAAPGGAVVVDPCSLMTQDEATLLAGEPAATPALVAGGCLYFDPSTTGTGVGLYALPGAQAQGFLGQYVPALVSNGVPLDQGDVDQMNKDSAAGDMPAAINDLFVLTRGLPSYEITLLPGVGSAALWSWHTLDQNQEGVLFAAKPGALVTLILRGTPTTQEAVAQPAMVAIVTRILAKLPESFTVVGAH